MYDDELREAMKEEGWTLGRQLAYQGKADCTSWTCRRLVASDEPGCMGWHCPICHEPTSQYGHDHHEEPEDG